MCGIAGVFYFHNETFETEFNSAKLANLTKSIEHRGPDSRNSFTDPMKGFALIHSRLSIRDLSNRGNQPMTSSDKRFVITYNGELYGSDYRKNIPTERWVEISEESDTRHLIELFSNIGIKNAINSIEGMFAFAVYDYQRDSIYLARDKFGEKPLYFHLNDKRIVFCSEFSGVMSYGDFVPTIDREAAAAFMRHNYVPKPKTIVRNIMKLSPGQILEVKKNGEYTFHTYFDSTSHLKASKIQNVFRNQDLEKVLNRAVSSRMVSDVPIGVLLSGGIDSTLVAYFMQANSNQKIDSFSVGFKDKNFNEAPFAREVAQRIGTNHHEIYIDEQEACDLVRKINSIYSEPFADSSQIPTTLVSHFARQFVSVVLTGDGGDEMFGGYSRYSRVIKHTSSLKGSIEEFLRNHSLPRKILINVVKGIDSRILNTLTSTHDFKGKIRRRLEESHEHDFLSTYRASVSHWPEPSLIVNSDGEFQDDFWRKGPEISDLSELDQMRLADFNTYLPDDILTKVDRATMSVALEARSPFLDVQVFDYANSLGASQLLHDGELKSPLKSLAYQLIGRDIMDRKKMGFGIPIANWLRGPLREWAETIIKSESHNNIFNEELLKIYWERHKQGEDWGYWIWNYLILKDWLLIHPEVEK